MGRIPEGSVVVAEDGKVTQGYKSPAVDATWPHHRNMARMVVQGYTPSEISAMTGFSSGHVSRILGSPAFQSEVARLEGYAEDETVSVHEDIQRIAKKAIEILDTHVQAPAITDKEKDRQQKTCFDMLDRAGYGKTEFHVSKNLHLHAKIKDVEKMKTEDLQDDLAMLIEED